MWKLSRATNIAEEFWDIDNECVCRRASANVGKALRRPCGALRHINMQMVFAKYQLCPLVKLIVLNHLPNDT